MIELLAILYPPAFFVGVCVVMGAVCGYSARAMQWICEPATRVR